MVNRLLKACGKPIESLLEKDSAFDNNSDEYEDDEEEEEPSNPLEIICIGDNLKFLYLLSTRIESNDVALLFESAHRSAWFLRMINDKCSQFD